MYIPEIIYPGSRVGGPDPDQAWRIAGNIWLFEGWLADAALALDYFLQAQRELVGDSRQERWDERVEILRLAQERALTAGVDIRDRERWMALERDVELERKRARWRDGRAPDAFLDRRVYMHARGFLYALDRVDKSFDTLLELTPLAAAHAANAQFKADFPHLHGVRNSVAHFEDRIRGLKTGGKRVALQPIFTQSITAKNGAIVLEHLHGDRFGCTMADGAFGEVIISEASLRTAVKSVQRCVDAFQWIGPSRHWPD